MDKEYQKFLRKERKIIEGRLHPIPTINGWEIAHEHRNKSIIFSAWKDQSPHPAQRSFIVHRTNVLLDEEFYKTWNEELRRLTLSEQDYLALKEAEWKASGIGKGA